MASPFAETCPRTSNPCLLSSAHSDIDYCVVLTDGAGGTFQSPPEGNARHLAQRA